MRGHRIPAAGRMRRPEWPTLGLIAACYGAWGLALAVAPALPWIGYPLLVLSITLHSSLQHEVIHGHPFADRGLNQLTVFPALGLFVPYLRFEATHLAHHQDANLTDPYDDPESFYLSRRDWSRAGTALRLLLGVNNTLAGRLLLGPAISLANLVSGDVRAIRHGDWDIAWAWVMHVPALMLVTFIIAAFSDVPLAAYAACAYAAMSALMLRTFAEHQAHRHWRGRSVIIESRGLPALLFLNNNLHAVHHAAPDVPWYALPARYRARRERYLKLNRYYVYPGYWALVRAHLLRAKEPVPHPFIDGPARQQRTGATPAAAARASGTGRRSAPPRG